MLNDRKQRQRKAAARIRQERFWGGFDSTRLIYRQQANRPHVAALGAFLCVSQRRRTPGAGSGMRRSGSSVFLKYTYPPGFLVFWFFEIRAAPAPGVVHAAGTDQTRNSAKNSDSADVVLYGSSVHQFIEREPPTLMEQTRNRSGTPRRRRSSVPGRAQFAGADQAPAVPVLPTIIQTQRPPVKVL